MNRNFMGMLRARWNEGRFVSFRINCDREFSKIPEIARLPSRTVGAVILLNQTIVEVTKDLVCAYNLPFASYAAGGAKGLEILRATILDIHLLAPKVPVILDAKFGGTDADNAQCVQMAFDHLQADAVTVYPYLGAKELGPFLNCGGKGIFVFCCTGNPNAGGVQDMSVAVSFDEMKYLHRTAGLPLSCESGESRTTLYRHVAYRVKSQLNQNGNCALIVGASRLNELESIRKIVGDVPIFIPDINAQSDDVEQIVSVGKDIHGQGIVIDAPQSVTLDSNGENFAEAVRHKTQEFAARIYIAAMKSRISSGQASPL